MILYHNGSFFRLVFTLQGSIFFRRSTLCAGLFIGMIALLLQLAINEGIAFVPKLDHHVGIASFGSIVSFAVVFRTSLGWGRYWEAMTQLHVMYSKWADCYSQVHAFAQTTLWNAAMPTSEAAVAKAQRIRLCLGRLAQNYSLMSAMAADRLAHGDTNRMEQRSNSASWSEQVVMRRDLRTGQDLTGGRKLPTFVSLDDPTRSKDLTQKLDKVWESEFLVLREPTVAERDALSQSYDRVNRVMYWIVYDLVLIGKDLDVAHPIQSRMYQELSNAMLGFSNCLKIADVPFPFPYAQLLTLLLVVYACFIPVFTVCFTDSLIASPILAFLLFEGMWGVNEVAKELENPFGHDVNDISLEDFHARYLDHLLDVRSDSIPMSKAVGLPDSVVVPLSKSGLQLGMSLSSLEKGLAEPVPLSKGSPHLGVAVDAWSGATPSGKAGPALSLQGASTASTSGRSAKDELVQQMPHMFSQAGSQESAWHSAEDMANEGMPWQEIPREPANPVQHECSSDAARGGSALRNDANSFILLRPPKFLPQQLPTCTPEALSQPQTDSISEVIDHNLALINKRMEGHLAQVANQLERLVMIVAAPGARLSGSDAPA